MLMATCFPVANHLEGNTFPLITVVVSVGLMVKSNNNQTFQSVHTFFTQHFSVNGKITLTRHKCVTVVCKKVFPCLSFIIFFYT